MSIRQPVAWLPGWPGCFEYMQYLIHSRLASAQLLKKDVY